jgi:hypothetical protein
MRHLWSLLQCAGRSRAGFDLVERATSVVPLAAIHHYPRAQFLWILGRDAEADRVIDLAMRYWPRHQFVRFARFTILAFTGRPRAALAMLDGKGTAPQNFTPEASALWRVSLAALDQPTQQNVETARAANLDAARQNLGLARQAALTLSALGEVDAAFQAAGALFAVRTEADPRQAPADPRPRRKSTAWRFAPWLFTPPCAALRADARFTRLCEEIGLADYWAKRGVRPDYQLA